MSQIPEDSRFPQQENSVKIHGVPENTGQKEKYLQDSGKIEDYPENDDGTKTEVDDKSGGLQDGHVREWEDRARVILDMKQEINSPNSPNQSPGADERLQDDVEEKSENLRSGKQDTPY